MVLDRAERLLVEHMDPLPVCIRVDFVQLDASHGFARDRDRARRAYAVVRRGGDDGRAGPVTRDQAVVHPRDPGIGGAPAYRLVDRVIRLHRRRQLYGRLAVQRERIPRDDLGILRVMDRHETFAAEPDFSRGFARDRDRARRVYAVVRRGGDDGRTGPAAHDQPVVHLCDREIGRAPAYRPVGRVARLHRRRQLLGLSAFQRERTGAVLHDQIVTAQDDFRDCRRIGGVAVDRIELDVRIVELRYGALAAAHRIACAVQLRIKGDVAVPGGLV